jgi:hypothetical protein
MRQRVFTSTSWLRRAVGGILPALLLVAAFAAASPTASAAPQAPTNSLRPQGWVYPYEQPLTFCDYDVPVCLEVDGTYGDLCGCPGPIYTQFMGITIKNGGYWGETPYTRVDEYLNGYFQKSFSIQGGSCVSPGWPSASVCGDNYTDVYHTSCIVMRHYWFSVDGDGIAFYGYWSHQIC